MSFFADLANTLGAQLGDNLLDRTGQFINQIAPLFQAGFGIYVLMVILSYYGQSGTVSLIDFVKRSAGWIVLIALAFSPSVYSKLAHTIYGLPDEISALFTNGAKFDVAAIDHSYTELENAIIRIGKLHSKYSWMEIGNHLALVEIRIVISLCGMLLIGVAFAYYTIAKISLALVLMLGAFFIGCLIFPATRQYGINWIGQCLNHIITCTMFVLLTVVQMEVFQGLVNQISNGDWTNHIFLEALIPVFILDTIVFLVIAWGIPGVASALTGGAAVQGFARSLAMSGGAIGRAGAAVLSSMRQAAARPHSAGGSIAKGVRAS